LKSSGPRRALQLAALGLLLSGCAGSVPERGDPLTEGLPPCPPSPNCVHTLDRHPQGTDPLMLSEGWRDRPPGALFTQVDAAITTLPRTRVVDTELAGGIYFRAESMSRVFRFVDDLEVRWVPGSEELEVRSASRVGRSDRGVNEARVEALRDTLAARGIIR
jgi:uncharacterized protein (DUF1499 family)